MKKYLAAIIVLSFIPHAAISSDSLIHDDEFSCYVKTNSVWDAIASFFTSDTGRVFHFCGKPAKTNNNGKKGKCADKKKRNKDSEKIYISGQYFEADGMIYQCCNGTQDKTGKFVYGAAISATEVKTKELPFGGKCNYTVTTDLCGTETKTDCNIPETCTDGTILRNGKCITPPIDIDNPQNKDADGNECKDGTYARNGECVPGHISGNTAYESSLSNKVIVCPTTDTQGIDKNLTCIKCDFQNQRWNRKTKTCIDFVDMKKYSKESLKKCWECPSIIDFETCVQVFSSSNSNKHPKYSTIKKDCLIQDE